MPGKWEHCHIKLKTVNKRCLSFFIAFLSKMLNTETLNNMITYRHATYKINENDNLLLYNTKRNTYTDVINTYNVKCQG